MNTLLRSEILQDTHAGAINLEPRWLKVETAVTYSGISRAVLYRILAEGKIRSSSLRSRGASRGIRLIDRASLDAFIESFAGKYGDTKARRNAI
jgi:Helix-turn-helix domain